MSGSGRYTEDKGRIGREILALLALGVKGFRRTGAVK